MKDQLTFKNKLKIFIKWMKQHKEGGLVVTCHFCKSTVIKMLRNKEEDFVYESEYKCLKCGARAINKEVWYRR